VLHEDFAEAFVHRPEPHVVCGLRLLPYSRWHAANLDFIESPFVGNKRRESSTFAELSLAAECCRLRYPQVVRLRRDPLYRFRRVLAERKYLKDPLGEINAFKAYLDDYGSKPEIVSAETDDGSSTKNPWYFYEVCCLLKLDPRLTRTEAWNMEVGEGGWWMAGHAEAAGAKIDLVTPEDIEQIREAGIKLEPN
jgi:hypothetical protein